MAFKLLLENLLTAFKENDVWDSEAMEVRGIMLSMAWETVRIILFCFFLHVVI
jgi:hypothetical protein